MRRACLPFFWQSLHAASALSDTLSLPVFWLSCGCCSSFAYGRVVDATASVSSPPYDSGGGFFSFFPPRRCCRGLFPQQILLSFLFGKAKKRQTPFLPTSKKKQHPHLQSLLTL